MALNQIQVGIQNNADTTNAITARAGKQGESMVSELHARYYEQTYRGNMFGGAIAGQVTTVGLATTYTGLLLSNPIGSAVNLVLNKCGYAFTVAFPAGSAVGLFTGFNGSTNVTHTATVQPRNQLFNGAAGGGRGLLDSSATMPTAPTLNTLFGAGLTGAITTTPFGLAGLVELEGSLILTPGAYAGFYTSTISGAAGSFLSFSWEEVPI
jgi:hypothetical protein